MISSFFIVTFLSAVLGCYVLVYSYSYFSEKKIKITNRERIIILIFSLIMSINNLYNHPSLMVIVTLFIAFMFYYILFEDTFYKRLLLSNYILLLSLITEFIISVLLSTVVSNIYFVNNSLLLKIAFSIIYFWSFYFVYKIPVFKYLYKKIFTIFIGKKNIILFVYSLLAIIGIMYAIYSLDYNNLTIYIFSLFTISLFIIVIFNYFKELNNNQILNIKNKYLIEKQLLYKTTLDDFRVLKHNLLNDFLFISSLCNQDVQEIINEKITKYNINIANFNDFNNIPEGLQGIIYFKSSIARKQNIEFYIDGNCEFKIKKLNKRLYIDLCEVIGIILDNAVEAANKANYKAIYLNTYCDYDSIKISVLNTYNNDIDLSDIGNKNYSTKKRNSGLGLYYIQRLNKDIKIKKDIINDLFKIEIVAKIK